MFIRSYKVAKGETLTAGVTAAQKTGLVANGEYAISNKTADQIVFINTDGATATVAASMPVFPMETKIVRCPLGTLNYIADTATTLVLLNKVESAGT